MRRFFVTELGPDAEEAFIKTDELRHLKNVLRLKKGDEVTVFDGKGHEYVGTIGSIGKRFAWVELTEEKIIFITESPFNITLFQALIKSDGPELIVQKSIELGVSEIYFFTSERTVPELDEKRMKKKIKRLIASAVGAAKQCERAIIPDIKIIDFEEALGIAHIAKKEELKIAFYEGEKVKTLKHVVSAYKGVPCPAVSILIGPEGGFTEQEVGLARQAGFEMVGLGPRILRAGTAAIAAATLLQYEFGDMG